MIIEIAHIVIDVHLNFLKEFKSIAKYQVEKEAKYKICSHLETCPMPNGKPVCQTTFYDLYQVEDKTIQVQKLNGKTTGFIVYSNKTIDVYMVNPCFALEYLLTQYALVYLLKEEGQALFMHGSSILYKNKGIMFTAKSGTGKSTHTALWRKYSDAVTINDDKNIILLENEKLMLYPNPWSGKHMLDNKIVSSLDAIVFLHQSKVNEVKRLSPIQAFKLLLGQIEQPSKANLEVWNQVVDKMNELPLYSYGCNMEKEAFDVICERLEKDLCM